MCRPERSSGERRRDRAGERDRVGRGREPAGTLRLRDPGRRQHDLRKRTDRRGDDRPRHRLGLGGDLGRTWSARARARRRNRRSRRRPACRRNGRRGAPGRRSLAPRCARPWPGAYSASLPLLPAMTNDDAAHAAVDQDADRIDHVHLAPLRARSARAPGPRASRGGCPSHGAGRAIRSALTPVGSNRAVSMLRRDRHDVVGRHVVALEDEIGRVFGLGDDAMAARERSLVERRQISALGGRAGVAGDEPGAGFARSPCGRSRQPARNRRARCRSVRWRSVRSARGRCCAAGTGCAMRWRTAPIRRPSACNWPTSIPAPPATMARAPERSSAEAMLTAARAAGSSTSAGTICSTVAPGSRARHCASRGVVDAHDGLRPCLRGPQRHARPCVSPRPASKQGSGGLRHASEAVPAITIPS